MSNRSCRHETLARNSVAHVQRCEDCGNISIHMGPVTVRFSEASFEALWDALGEATMVLRAEKQANRLVARGVA